jgi:uncharacterized protein (TIGR00661 family)
VPNNTNINKIVTNKRVLVAPLDWGLGHATRCVPIIAKLLASGFEVIIAAEKAGAALLKKEFPSLQFIELKGYNIAYGKSKIGFLFKIIKQIPAIRATIKYENKWLATVIEDYKIDIVLSDNRFGLCNKNVTCIFITHQLLIKTGNIFTEKILQQLNYSYINKFDQCWVPDEASNTNFAGELSHPKKLPKITLAYIGTLSRFKKTEQAKEIDLLVILSGPEPQRTILENILLKQMQQLPLRMVLVRGLPIEQNNLTVKNIIIHNHLPAVALNKLILSAKTVVARSGYTTVMDLAALQQQVIFIPTPGQTEQEYLAKYLSAKKYCITMPQQNFNLQVAINEIEKSNLISFPDNENNLLINAINGLL